MLSFGHAVYTGLGSFIAIHAMNMAGDGLAAGIPLVLIPLVGGLAGAFFAILLGFVTTKVWHHLRHDHAGCGRAGGRHGADVP